ncbi:MAG: AraC family transcriptional regulator [Tannerellaceae bacterium]|nr:AraC family transcriptional regulator [Tannerellaceae bacterium]
MDRHVWLVIKDVEYYLLNSCFDPLLLQIKISELFYFFFYSYSPDSLAHFFAPVIFPDYVFPRFVLENYMSVKTVEELARLSHYSFSGFQKQFRKVFGIAPYQWMLMKKTEKVYYEIHKTSKPLKVIAEETGFAGLSQLSDFCRKRFGKSPTAIRKKI